MKNIKKFLLEAEDTGGIDIEISYRGGHYGIGREEAVDLLFEEKADEIKEDIINGLPDKVGVYCNYLGGGLRGSIVGGGYDKDLPDYAKKRIDEFVQCCKKRYEEIENEAGLNEEEDESGETNWDALGTNSSRNAGIVSAY